MAAWNPQANEIFLKAVEIHAPEDRRAYLDEACRSDAQLRTVVEALLTAGQQAGSFLESPAPGLTAAIDSSELSEQPGSVIGPYKLLEQIGEGGMGVVYMAEQQEPVRRRVALKLIKLGMDTRQVIARFEAERQALAVMDHPSIARVLDAGATESGRPYFVMELVRGVPITTFCDEINLPVRERLELFASVCQAIQHAHTKGIIHRDIKPTNVLVTRQDGRPVVKVIDFGVAKAMGQQLTEKTLFTNFAQMIGTPLYMSPEQAERSAVDIDTRSDIYSLGVLLYELLTGSTPVDAEQMKKAAFDEIRRIIREDGPPTPSVRISGSHTLPAIAAHRHIEPARLSKLVRGELDWIVMKALEKDRNRRYETANAFAADLLHYLHDEPVQACPPSATYRFGKFARRNRVAITTATLVAAALVLGTIVSTWQAIRADSARAAEAEQRKIAEAERSEAQKQRELADANFQKARKAVDEYFTLVSESKLLDVPGMQPLRKELLEAALRYYQAMRNERADDPAVLADLVVAQLHVANVYHELDRDDDALAAIESALPLAERLRRDYPLAVEDHRRLAGYWKVYRGVSSSTEMPKDPVAAHRTLTKFLQLWEGFARENPSVAGFQSDLASINNLLAAVEGGRGAAGEPAAFTRAISYGSKAIAIWEQLSQAHPDDSRHRENLARAYSEIVWEYGRAGQKDQARKASARAMALQEKLIAQSPSVPTYRVMAAQKLTELASSLADGRPREAEKSYQQALQAWQKLAADFPAAHEYTIEFARAQFKYAEALAGPLNRPDDAIWVFQEGNEQLKKLAAEYPAEPRYRRELATAPRGLARRLSDLKVRLGDAEKLHLQSLGDFNELAKEFPNELSYVERTGHSYRYLGWIARDTGRPAEAIDYFEKGIAAFQKLADADIPQRDGFYRDYLADTLQQRVGVLAGVGRADEAEKTIPQVIEMYELLVRDYPKNADYRRHAADAVRVLAELFAQQKKLPEASAEAQKAVRLAPNEFAIHEFLLDILTRIGDKERTLAVLRENVAALPDCAMAHHHLGVALERQSYNEEAIAEFEKTAKLRPDWEWPHLCIASNYAVLGNWDKAGAEYTKTFEMAPASWWKIIDSLKAKGEPADREKVVRQLITAADKRADDVQVRTYRGALHRELGELDKAIADFSWIIAKDPTRAEAWDLRGNCDHRKGEFAKAVEDYSQAIKLKPDRWEAWTGRAWAYFHLQQWDRAVSDFSKAIDLAPQVHTNWFHRGHAYLNLAQWDKAAADFAKVVDQWPNDPEGWYLRGVAYAQLNQPDKALADLHQAIAKGFKGELIKNDPRLAPLRSNDDFKTLLTTFEKEKK